MIRPTTNADAEAHWRHYRRLGEERGRDGEIIYSPNESEWNVPLEKFVTSYRERWSRPITEVGWERAWVLADEAEIYGELILVHRPPLESCLHRATLMMGIERGHRGRGLGTQLIHEAIRWAKEQPGLVWLQLYVFAQNVPAQKLYAKFGFRENGRTADMFRVHGQQIEDISMVLKLR